MGRFIALPGVGRRGSERFIRGDQRLPGVSWRVKIETGPASYAVDDKQYIAVAAGCNANLPFSVATHCTLHGRFDRRASARLGKGGIAGITVAVSMEDVMFRNFAVVVGYAAILVLFTAASVPATQFGTAEEAKAMLEKAVAAVKEDKAKALDMFNNGEGGFKDRDLYVWCANAADGILTAHPTNKGKELRDIEGKKGSPFGKEIMQKAAEGTIKEITYWWPRPDSDKPLEKTTLYTKAGDQICGVGYYKE